MEKGVGITPHLGKRVAVIELAEHLGVSCISTRTVPSKTLPAASGGSNRADTSPAHPTVKRNSSASGMQTTKACAAADT